MKRFDDTRVLVTGGANGLGLGIAQRFVAEGAVVWIADQDPKTEVIAERHGATGSICDVSDSTQVDALFATMTAQLAAWMWWLRMPGLAGRVQSPR